MSDPYRQNSKPPETPLRKYMRLKARVRGLWRRVAGPTIFICVIGGLFTFINVMSCTEANHRGDNSKAQARRHFDDWQAAIDKSQAEMNTRQYELNKRETDFNSRVRNFEDLVSMSPMLMKEGNDSALKEALKRVKQPNKKD